MYCCPVLLCQPGCTAEVVEVVRYRGPVNATIIRRHQQWLDAAQVMHVMMLMMSRGERLPFWAVWACLPACLPA